MLEIMRYYNTKTHYIVILFDETSEEVLAINKSNDTFKVFDDLKNMPIDMLRYVAEDFDSLINIDSSQIRYSLENIENDNSKTQIIGVFMNDRYNEAVNDKIEELEEKGYKEDIDFNVYYEDVSIER